MASTYNRGTRSKPRHYASVKLLDGTWKAYPTHANSQGEAQKIANRMQQRADQGLPVIEVAPETLPTVGDLMDKWIKGLENRNKRDDEYRARKYLVPAFGKITLPELSRKRIAEWLGELKALKGDARLSSASQRQCFNLISRFFSWCIDNEHTEVNPCRMFTRKSKVRPSGKAERVRTWIADEKIARTIFHALRYPFDVVFLTGYVAGLRPGEVCGLRLSDADWIGEEAPEARVLRVRFSRLGPLKEAHDGEHAVKWAVTSDDLIAHLGPHLARRRAQGAQGEDLVFANADGSPISKMQISREWKRLQAPKEVDGEATDGAGLELPAGLDWYGATRHTFVNRQLSANPDALESVSDAIGHANSAITAKNYQHVIRKTFPVSMRQGLGVMPGAGAKVLTMGKTKKQRKEKPAKLSTSVLLEPDTNTNRGG